jgi:hypothetical protein
LRQTALSQLLPVWLDHLEQHQSTDPLISLLSMLLNANGVDAQALLKYMPDVLRQPAHWHYVPLQLDAAVRQLQEQHHEPA